MDIKFEKIFERDIDLLIINNFSKGLLIDLFLAKINRIDYKIELLEHSFQNQYGENDITVILNNGKNRIALLIEDKIDAPAMIEQATRYSIRGEKLVDDKIVNEYFVFIIAPKKYLEGNQEAKKYPNSISYEELMNNIKDDYSKSVFTKALDESKHGYNVIEDTAVTKFWNDLYDYIEDVYDDGVFKINIDRGPKGSKACWPTFHTNHKSINIIYKSNQGNVDLEFPRVAKKYNDIKNAFISKGISINEIETAGDSIVIRKHVDVVKFSDDFKSNEEKVDKALQTVLQLERLLYSKDLAIDYENVLNGYELINPADYDIGIISDGLKKYSEILDVYNKTSDITKSADFQRIYDAFYRVRRNAEWRLYYFKLMQESRTKEINFEFILTSIYKNTGRVEASFSSKLLSTIDPNMPIWDQYVLANLGLKATPQYMNNKLRLKKSIELYNSICKWYTDRINSNIGKAEIAFFDKTFTKYTWISNVKKIDFLLWSKR